MRLRRVAIFLFVVPFVFANLDKAAAQTPTQSELATETPVPSESTEESDDLSPESIQVDIEFKEQSWFTDVVALAIVKVPGAIDEPETPPSDEDVSFLSVDTLPSQEKDSSGTQVMIRFLPRRPGLVIFPSLEFRSETQVYRTSATQLLVDVPQRSSEMQFELKPSKTTVYVGEPLRVDVTWSIQLPANQIRSLQCVPPFFNEEEIEVVVPRCTAAQEQQLGMPFGGRRIVAKRVPPTDDTKQFGTVSFPIFLRFDAPGKVEFPPTRLECAVLKQNGTALAPYAAYYNNGLFESMSSLKAYDRIFAESVSLSFDVLPLPSKERSELFSGLFDPCEVDVSASTDELNVGQVLEVDLRIHSDAPHGMLELQPLSLQRSLRGSFQVSEEFGRTWFPDGTGFRARVRPLTTKVSAFPSVQIPIFDPKRGVYRSLQTKPVPVRVTPQDGRDYFDVRSLAAESTLTDQPDGIWHNSQPASTRKWMNAVVTVLAEYMYAWILFGTVLFAIIVPWVRELRRQATSSRYRQQALAYRNLRSQPEGSPQKWQAFREFLASGFSMSAGAWTSGDAATRLRELGLPEADIDLIATVHDKVDASEFSAEKPTSEVPNLDELASRLLDVFRKSSLVLLFGIALSPSVVMASDWEDGQALFRSAMGSPSGLPETVALFSKAALKFEASVTTDNQPGDSWYNAGNAWFQAGELGRSIACYRQARIYLPFHAELRDNLKAARALTVDVVEHQRGVRFESWPVRWIAAMFVPVWLMLLLLLLLHFRFRTVLTRVVCVAFALLSLVMASIGIHARSQSGSEGVIIVGEIFGRKGPAYSYATAFNEPLHDGLEFSVKTHRSDWLQIALSDGRQCWIPSEHTQLINNKRL